MNAPAKLNPWTELLVTLVLPALILMQLSDPPRLGAMPVLLSYPMIALPSLLIMMTVLYYLARSIRALTGLGSTEVLRHG